MDRKNRKIPDPVDYCSLTEKERLEILQKPNTKLRMSVKDFLSILKDYHADELAVAEEWKRLGIHYFELTEKEKEGGKMDKETLEKRIELWKARRWELLGEMNKKDWESYKIIFFVLAAICVMVWRLGLYLQMPYPQIMLYECIFCISFSVFCSVKEIYAKKRERRWKNGQRNRL